MVKQHKKLNSLITMALYEHKSKIPYGVIETNGNKVTAWKEKPEISSSINIGCYAMEKEVLDLIPKNKPYGMDDVIKKADQCLYEAKNSGRNKVVFKKIALLNNPMP